MATIETEEFRERLSIMRDKLASNIDRLQQELNFIVAEDEIDDEQDLATLESDNMHHSALLAQQRRELAEVEHALAKIDAGTYGICEESGHKIPVERLRAEPHTRYCIKHARKAEQPS